MSEIESLTARVRDLTQSVDWWNSAMLLGLALAAAAAIFVLVATRIVVKESGRLSEVQGQLSDAKDRQLQADLKEKDRQIASLNVDSEGLKQENLRLQSHLVDLRKESEARRLTGKQKSDLENLLSGVKGRIGIVSPIADGEASDLADDLDSAIKKAGWDTFRIKNRITEKFGVSVVTIEGSPKFRETKLLGHALTAIGVPHDFQTFKDGDASTSPYFQKGFLYLVVEHKPLPAKAK